MKCFTHWVSSVPPNSTCFSRRSLLLPCLLKARTFIKGSHLKSVWWNHMWVYTHQTKPTLKGIKPFFFFFLFQSIRTFLAFQVGCWVGKPDPDLPYSLISRSAFAVESSVCINLLGPTQRSRVLLIILMVYFQLPGQRTLPVYKHEIDSHCLEGSEQERTLWGQMRN